MMAPPPGQERPFEQNNNGPGTFIGRDNYGPIEMVDAKTKAVLEKLSKEAPMLGQLLSKALQDGVISPAAARSLEYAARSINDDVTNALLIAGRNINEDVANSLAEAGRNINRDAVAKLETVGNVMKENVEKYQCTANRIFDTSTTLEDLVNRLHEAASGLDGRIKSVQTSTAPSVITSVNWRVTARAFAWGVALGAAALLFLAVDYHWSFK